MFTFLRFESNKAMKKDSKHSKWGSLLSSSSSKKKADGSEETQQIPKMAKGVGYSTYNHKGWDIQVDK